jgi:SH3 domain protein
MRNRLLKTLFLLLLCQGANAAETLYVHDQLRVGVRAAPDSSGHSIAVVTTGDALTVLGEENNFAHIRTEQGVEGWVSKSYLSDELPARKQLASLQKEHEELQLAQAELQQQLTECLSQTEQQAGKLMQLEQDNSELQQQLGRYTRAATSGLLEQYRWWLLLGALLTCFVGGLISGVRWKARQVARRIGGLKL